jgi:phosphoribosyl 1,2-cyclic phosphodiesterase
MAIMSLEVASLNSGSNGNCYYIGNAEEAILVDGGISLKEAEKRMKRLGLSLEKVKAIFISHEHGDHIHGLPALVKKYKFPVYITPETYTASNLHLDHPVESFTAYEPVNIGGLSVSAFPKFHDARDPHSFVITHGNVSVGVFTDIGKVCDHVIKNFKQCHAVFLETNYDAEMLMNGRYPWHLKERVCGDYGHLSNVAARQLFMDHRAPFLSHLFLSHISRENNKVEMVQNFFKEVSRDTEIVIASRDRETDVYTIKGHRPYIPPRPVQKVVVEQLSLFG